MHLVKVAQYSYFVDNNSGFIYTNNHYFVEILDFAVWLFSVSIDSRHPDWQLLDNYIWDRFFSTKSETSSKTYSEKESFFLIILLVVMQTMLQQLKKNKNHNFINPKEPEIKEIIDTLRSVSYNLTIGSKFAKEKICQVIYMTKVMNLISELTISYAFFYIAIFCY